MTHQLIFTARGKTGGEVYAPLQEFRKLFDRETALHKGTIFSELDLPFLGATVMKGGHHRD